MNLWLFAWNPVLDIRSSNGEIEVCLLQLEGEAWKHVVKSALLLRQIMRVTHNNKRLKVITDPGSINPNNLQIYILQWSSLWS